MPRWLAASSVCSSTISVTVQKLAKRKTWWRTKESSHEPSGATPPSWPRPALQLSRAPHALDRGVLLHLSLAHRTRVLVALAFLDRCDPRRRSRFAHASSLDRSHFYRRRSPDVQHVGFADGLHGCGPCLVSVREPLHPQRR